MEPILSTEKTHEHIKAVGLYRDPIDQLCSLYESLSQDVVLCKRFLEDILVSQKSSREKSYLNRILVKSNKNFIFVTTGSIYWIEAWGDYIRLHCTEKIHVVRQKICDIEKRLDPRRFLRISRSAVVNIEHIKLLEPLNHGDYLLTLADNTQLNLSRNYRDRLTTLFENDL